MKKNENDLLERRQTNKQTCGTFVMYVLNTSHNITKEHTNKKQRLLRNKTIQRADTKIIVNIKKMNGRNKGNFLYF